MYMRSRWILSAVAFLLVSAGYSGNAAVYEASTLYNAVSRSETVQDLFFQRWDIIQEKELYFDFFGKINWVPGFQINTIKSATGKKEAVDMRLIRSYGSITVNYPILGGYEGKDLNERLTKGSGYKKEDDREGKDEGLFKPKNLILGFTATGFHYGLTSESTVNRGQAGQETVTDYKYTQFFDDIYAVSLLYRPYFFIHAGVVVNNQIEPNDDGTMDYSNSTGRSVRYFVGSNLLSFLNVNAATTKDKMESMAVGLILNKGFDLLTKKSSGLPKITVTYKILNIFNDEPYDAVWVKTAAGKSDSMDNSGKEKAQLRTLSAAVEKRFGNRIVFNAFAELQKPSQKLIEKRTVTDANPGGDEIKFALMREMYASAGYNLLAKNPGQLLLVNFGLSRFWDVAIPVHRESGFGYAVTGWFASLSYEKAVYGAEFKVSRNYSNELRKLVETTDKYMIEGSLFGRF